MKIITKKLVQDAQDKIFGAMSAERKIKLAGSFFRFAKKLNPGYFLDNGGRRIGSKNREHIKRS